MLKMWLKHSQMLTHFNFLPMEVEDIRSNSIKTVNAHAPPWKITVNLQLTSISTCLKNFLVYKQLCSWFFISSMFSFIQSFHTSLVYVFGLLITIFQVSREHRRFFTSVGIPHNALENVIHFFLVIHIFLNFLEDHLICTDSKYLLQNKLL